MQQLGHLQWADRHPHLAAIAREWEECVREMRQRGHDVQLHVHRQWLDGTYGGDRWHLNENWSIIEYPESTVRCMNQLG